MGKMIVIVPKLNKRKLPVTDTSNKGNIVGVVNNGYTFDSQGSLTNSLGTWYQDSDGYYYWGGGVSAASAQTGQVVLADRAQVFSDFWFNNLGIVNIWNDIGEKGDRASALILDSGINTKLPGIFSAVEKTNNFVPGSTTIDNLDKEFHGTHCGSLIAARSNKQFIGAAPACKLLVGKITDNGSLDDSSTMKAALTEYLEDGYEIDIISISQEIYLYDKDLEDLLVQHISKNRIIVASIGNDYDFQNSNFKRYPGCLDECISVGSCTNSMALSKFSMNPGGTTIFCFGENIMSYQASTAPGPLSGTSQATAIVAGICCLIISWLKKNSFTYNQVSIKNLLSKYSSKLTGNSNLSLISPQLIFNQLKNFKNYASKDLQSCIDNPANTAG